MFGASWMEKENDALLCSFSTMVTLVYCCMQIVFSCSRGAIIEPDGEWCSL